MAATSGRADRVYHQDYIARIRYSNTLPPPPNPPKFLDIPNTGLSSGQYTSPAFASRLARDQPLNIEADAELGMPIDLVGIPGVFDGNEDAIYALDNPPIPHPHDKYLLRPLAALGKTTSMTSGVSFLRRTEYISSSTDQTQGRVESSKARDLRQKQDLRKRKRPDADRDDPATILRAVTRGFDIAYPGDAADGGASLKGLNAELQAWNNPRHPTQPHLKPLDIYPVLPDIDAFTELGHNYFVRFITNPSTNDDAYDPRLDFSLLKVIEPGPEIVAQIEAQRAAHEVDPSQPAPGAMPYDYEVFLPRDATAVDAIRAKFDVNNPDKDSTGLYDYENPDSGKRCFRYDRLREYETYQQKGDIDDSYGDMVALALHDGIAANGSTSRLQKGAYFYPIYQRAYIRPRRHTKMGPMGIPVVSQRVEEPVDFLEVEVRDPEGAEIEARERFKKEALEGPGLAGEEFDQTQVEVEA